MDALLDAVKTPPYLQRLARTAVHRAFGSRLPRSCIPQLPLPEPLRAYLFFPDLDVGAMLQAYRSTVEAFRASTLVV
jgi:hypothetical protein